VAPPSWLHNFKDHTNCFCFTRLKRSGEVPFHGPLGHCVLKTSIERILDEEVAKRSGAAIGDRNDERDFLPHGGAVGSLHTQFHRARGGRGGRSRRTGRYRGAMLGPQAARSLGFRTQRTRGTLCGFNDHIERPHLMGIQPPDAPRQGVSRYRSNGCSTSWSEPARQCGRHDDIFRREVARIIHFNANCRAPAGCDSWGSIDPNGKLGGGPGDKRLSRGHKQLFAGRPGGISRTDNLNADLRRTPERLGLENLSSRLP
jgi:hypothetical protein